MTNIPLVPVPLYPDSAAKTPDVQPWRVRPVKTDPAHNPEFRKRWNQVQNEYESGVKTDDQAHADARHRRERTYRQQRAALLAEFGFSEDEVVRGVRAWNRD